MKIIYFYFLIPYPSLHHSLARNIKIFNACLTTYPHYKMGLNLYFSDLIKRLGNKRRTKQVEFILLTVPIIILQVVVLASIIVVYLDLDPFKAISKWSGISGITSDLLIAIPVILIRLLSIGKVVVLASIIVVYLDLERFSQFHNFK